MNEIFSEIEFEELNSLLQDFDNILLEEYDTYSTKVAYWEFSQRIAKNNSIPTIKGIDSLGLSVMEYKVFDKIWWKYKNTELNTIKYNFADKSIYLKYLKLVGKNSDFIKNYTEIIESTNDLVPSIIYGFAKNIKKTDLENENVRLIFAIHYLTVLNR